MARRNWTCPKCRTINAPTKSRKCGGCGELTRPALRKSEARKRHEATPYADYAVLSVLIHGGEPHACGCCGKPKPDIGHHHREHDHATGNPRGLACVYCNKTVLGNVPVEALRRALAYHERVDAFYSRVELVK